MQISIRKKLSALFIVLFCLIVANYMLSQQVHSELESRHRLTEHSVRVLVSAEILLGHLRDAETGQRGYLLTLDPLYLEPYHRGVAEANRVVTELAVLVADNARQQEIIERVDRLKDEKFDELALTIDKASRDNIEGAITLVKENIGKNLMDELRVLLTEFDAIERKTFLQRDAAVKQIQVQMNSLFLIEIILLVAGVALLLNYTNRRLINPLMLMKKELERVVAGKESRTIHIKQEDEVGELASALNTMLQRLKARSNELDALVCELEQERDKALVASATDVMTGLANRRKFEQVGGDELKRASREHNTVNLVMIDVDYFKSVNDIYGHTTGDDVLCAIADCLSSMARRPNDFVFRLGGEEFVLLTSGMDAATAKVYADSMRLSVELLQIPNSGSDISNYVTISAGVVSVVPDKYDDIYSVLQEADRCLYKAKNRGRNCVVGGDQLAQSSELAPE
jgi:diguanylate cyclase (GGDEF)-like protein